MQETGEKRKRRRLSILPGNMHHTLEKKVVEAHSPAFLSLSGTAFDTAGEAAVDGGDVGSSSPIVARSPKVLEREVFSRVGGVPVREEAPESSPGRPREPPGPMRLPLLLREENIEVGPRVTF
jgi:hypothetical protein